MHHLNHLETPRIVFTNTRTLPRFLNARDFRDSRMVVSCSVPRDNKSYGVHEAPTHPGDDNEFLAMT
ncbi:hypothetical protein E2C01_013138 [Portunus trituberculatus]|uniref:Uncharacterized protein n=1 Tax=Portunus trituberculatus TaxID=210409 RepID=A0A5B7DG48_PORTR|nr:hypothetical protein [Portunus trituberculatus]